MLCKLCSTLEGFVTLHTHKDPSSAGLLLVKLQRGQVTEVLAAARAAVGFLFIVDVLVTNKAGSHGKRHAALGALVGSLSAVNGLVLGQVGGLREALGAHRADVRTHSPVDLLVLCHATGQSKGLPAVGTGERSFSQVLTLMSFQREGFIKGLATVRAWEGLVVGVHVPLMLSQVRGANEILSASVTDVGLLTGVCADMLPVI